MKNIYLLTQNKVRGYDTYDSMVVISEDEKEAKLLSFKEAGMLGKEARYSYWKNECIILDEPFEDYMFIEKRESCWSLTPDIKQIGVANPDSISEVVCASFNAG